MPSPNPALFQNFLILMVAIVYAGMWMVWAVRTHAANRFASITYGVTSATDSFSVAVGIHGSLPGAGSSFHRGRTGRFVVLALALSWQRDLQLIPWVATLAAVITALALIIATHDYWCLSPPLCWP